jgi:hypothetical protein
VKITSVGCTAHTGTMEHPDEFWEDRVLRPVDIYPPFGTENTSPGGSPRPSGRVMLAGNTIGGPASITGNSDGALVAANTITGPLSCSGNNPPRPTAGSPARSAARPSASAQPCEPRG